MTAKVTHRKTCRLCDSSNVICVLELKPIPLSENYCSDRASGKDAERYPIDLFMCVECGHVQQLDVVDSKSLWDNYSYFSSMANGMLEHFADIRDMLLEKYHPAKGSLVIDIGSNDGSLLRAFKDSGFNVLGIDPAIEVARQATESGIPTLPELMSLDLARKIKLDHGKADIICAFNVFAHADDLGGMVDSIKELLSDEGIFIFEAQYLLDILDKNIIATIFHEHISHHSVKPMVGFMERHGMELISVSRSQIQHGSLIGVVQHKGGKYSIDGTVGKLLQIEENRQLDKVQTLYDFAERVKYQKAQMEAFVERLKAQGASVAGYGAARSGPTLISQMGLTDVIEYIVDDHPQKIGLYSSGDGIKILPTSDLYVKMPDYTVILAWVHAQKIIANNRRYLEEGGKFIVLCPNISVVSLDSTETL